EGSLAGDPPEPLGEFSLEGQADEIEDRLGFLHTIAKLWRLAARPDVWPPGDPAADAALTAWLTAARRANDSLDLFLERLMAVEPLLVRIVRAIGRGDPTGVRVCLPAFLVHFRREPLLYCPPSDGGKPREVLQAQTALAVLEDLVTRLPRLGLLRETFQLTKL